MEYTKELIKFIKSSPTAFHTVCEVKKRLLSKGFSELFERETGEYASGNSHFVIRGDSSIIAFKGGRKKTGFMISASHTDTPSFKPLSLTGRVGAYTTLPVERYGGSILYSWLDRPLSVAGRAVVRREGGLSVELFDIDKDMFIIPSVAIHQNRTVNDGYKFNVAVDMLPLVTAEASPGGIKALVAKQLSAKPEDIISTDAYIYNREEGRIIGEYGEFVLAPRLDNLASVYTSLEAFINAPEREDAVQVFAAFNNEEVGSSTREGADSTFFSSVLTKIAGDESNLYRMLYDSLMVSLDNAHAKHPNHPELSNPEAAPILGRGVAVKYNANHLYATDAVSDGMIRTVAEAAKVLLQSYSSRADMPSGSTLGSIAATRLSVPTVDLGIPQLAMHSASECCACCDIDSAVKLLFEFYSAKIVGLSVK